MIALIAKRTLLRGESRALLRTARLLSLFVAGGIASSGSTPRNDAFAQEPPLMGTPAPTKHMSPVDLFSKLAPTVVKLIVAGEGGGVVGSGSGFVLSAPSSTICHVVTNYHVIRAAVHINVEFHDGSVAGVDDVLSEDPALDLAVLRVELPKPREPFAQVTLDIQNDDQPPIGTRLYAIGSPKGMKNTLSDGLLSGYRSEGSEVTWVQITNPISPGSSGGPVFTDTGAFIGITTASLSDAQNLNFAISAKKVKEFIAREKSSRPLWKGSCIQCEEETFLFRMHNELYERFCRTKGHADCSNLLKYSSDVRMWVLGDVLHSRLQQFQEFCTAEARAGDRNAMILTACFLNASAGPGQPERLVRLAEAFVLLERALPVAGDDTFFVLLAMGRVQTSILAAEEASGTLEDEARRKLLDAATRTLAAARDLRPKFPPTLFELANTLILSGKFPEALEVSSQTVRLVPNSPEARAQRAEILHSLGSKLAAIEELREVCKLNPYDEFAFMELGGLYTETGQHEKAIDAYRCALDAGSRLVAASPRNTEDSPELDAAIAEYHKAISRATFAWQLHCSIARAFVALKRYDEAVEAYRLALDAARDSAGPENRLMLERELAACRVALRRP